MHTYKVLRWSDGREVVIQLREDGSSRQVSPDHPGYTEWLEAGNVPEVEMVEDAPGFTLEQTVDQRKRDATAMRDQMRARGVLYGGV
ncbi:MAG: hypothetical protein ACLGQW_00885, partial [Acidobacteriota bacterium]